MPKISGKEKRSPPSKKQENIRTNGEAVVLNIEEELRGIYSHREHGNTLQVEVSRASVGF